MKTKYAIHTFNNLSLIAAIALSLFSSPLKAQGNQDSSTSAGRAQSAGGNFFTGGVATVVRMPTSPEINCGVAKVSFPPGVRTIWHAHAGGQIIVVTSGIAWYQEKGKSKQVVAQGETVVCAPGVMHWHGAPPDAAMTHTVATPNLDKGSVTAGLAVTDWEYKGIK